ncbi:MAG TPA: glycine zipper 2TM domain-containing protein [Burkholderiales bacterium]|jgi:outer membrane lipoprotein SlyB|nr:glycine zipper 2TM domain-containing protein [Burkholderiales bacterium]
MSEMQSRTNPIIIIAAIAVIIFCAVGVGVFTGLIPSTFSKNAPDAATPANEPAQQAAAEPKSQPAPTASSAQSTRPPVATKSTAAESAPPRTRTERTERPAPTPSVAVCTNCGTVEAINVQQHEGSGSGIGAVAGAVVGGLVGNQIGAGHGNTLATIAGAVGGAYAGNKVEEKVKSTDRYIVSVRMHDGSHRTFTYASQPGLAIGQHVKIENGTLVAAN